MTIPPFWLMRQAGRYLPEYRTLRTEAANFLEFCLTPELACEASLQPIRRYAMDAAIMFCDILVVPYGLGQAVWFEENAGPRLEAIDGPAGLARLDVADLRERLAPVSQTLQRIGSALVDEGFGGTTLIGFAGAPWTVAGYMVEGGSSRDFPRTKAWAYADPDSFRGLIDILVAATTEYLLMQAKAGAEVVQLFDSWAGLLPSSQFQRWVIEPTRRIVDGVRAGRPDVPIIGFPRGAGTMYRRYAIETGVDAVGLDTTVSPEWAAEALQRVCPVQGNLDPQMLVVGGQALEAETRRLLGTLSAGPYVFNLGHGVLPETPPEHVAELVAVLRNSSAGGR